MASLALDRIVRNGLAFDPKRTMPDTDIGTAVTEIFARLNAAGVDYLLVGGIAVLSFVEGRNTQDIDLVIDPADATAHLSGTRILDRDFGQASHRGIRIDLLLTTNPLFAQVRRDERTQIDFAGRVIPAATRKGLVLLKLYALPSLYRQGKLDRAALYETDILMLRRGSEWDDEELLGRLAPHLPSHDLAELRSVLHELTAREHRRFMPGPE
jgi:hypothetical protein